MSATIVTAYYELDHKKYASSSYYIWMRRFLTLDAFMIIFTGDETTARVIKDMRAHAPSKTQVVVMPFQELYCARFMDYWHRDHERDHEKAIHDPALYVLWNEKTSFLKKAYVLDPFDTDFFCWADIGMVRDDGWVDQIHTFPSANVLSGCRADKVFLLNVCPFTKEEEDNVRGATDVFRHTDRVGGGFIMCHRGMVEQWHDAYYKMLHDFFVKDLFAGKDQSILNCVCLTHAGMVELVHPEDPPFDKWFYMLYYFSDKPPKNPVLKAPKKNVHPKHRVPVVIRRLHRN